MEDWPIRAFKLTPNDYEILNMPPPEYLTQINSLLNADTTPNTYRGHLVIHTTEPDYSFYAWSKCIDLKGKISLNAILKETIMDKIMNVKFVYKEHRPNLRRYVYRFIVDLPNITEDDPLKQQYEKMLRRFQIEGYTKYNKCIVNYYFKLAYYVDRNNKKRTFCDFFKKGKIDENGNKDEDRENWDKRFGNIEKCNPKFTLGKPLGIAIGGTRKNKRVRYGRSRRPRKGSVKIRR